MHAWIIQIDYIVIIHIVCSAVFAFSQPPDHSCVRRAAPPRRADTSCHTTVASERPPRAARPRHGSRAAAPFWASSVSPRSSRPAASLVRSVSMFA